MFHYVDCGPNMYGGFNGSACQLCPPNTANNGGYSIRSCTCAGPCIGKILYICKVVTCKGQDKKVAKENMVAKI